jgi:hypothetical protein
VGGPSAFCRYISVDQNSFVLSILLVEFASTSQQCVLNAEINLKRLYLHALLVEDNTLRNYSSSSNLKIICDQYVTQSVACAVATTKQQRKPEVDPEKQVSAKSIH